SCAIPNACCVCGRLWRARDSKEKIWTRSARCCTCGIFWRTTGALPKPCGGGSRRIHSIPLLAEEGRQRATPSPPSAHPPLPCEEGNYFLSKCRNTARTHTDA